MSISDHELRDAVEQGWAAARRENPAPTVAYFQRLLTQFPENPMALHHCARSHNFAGEPDLAAPLYERAFAAGLSGDERRRGLTSYGSTLRNLEQFDQAIAALETAHQWFPEDALIICTSSSPCTAPVSQRRRSRACLTWSSPASTTLTCGPTNGHWATTPQHYYTVRGPRPERLR